MLIIIIVKMIIIHFYGTLSMLPCPYSLDLGQVVTLYYQTLIDLDKLFPPLYLIEAFDIQCAP